MIYLVLFINVNNCNDYMGLRQFNDDFGDGCCVHKSFDNSWLRLNLY